MSDRFEHYDFSDEELTSDSPEVLPDPSEDFGRFVAYIAERNRIVSGDRPHIVAATVIVAVGPQTDDGYLILYNAEPYIPARAARVWPKDILHGNGEYPHDIGQSIPGRYDSSSVYALARKVLTTYIHAYYLQMDHYDSEGNVITTTPAEAYDGE